MKEKHLIIKEAISTLVENSLDAGATQVTSKVDDEKGRFIIFVKDNGEGMNEETKEKVTSLLKKNPKKESKSSLENLVKYIDDYHLATREGAGTEITLKIK